MCDFYEKFSKMLFTVKKYGIQCESNSSKDIFITCMFQICEKTQNIVTLIKISFHSCRFGKSADFKIEKQ